MRTVIHYFDYKSPYAYLAQQPTFELARDTGAQIEWRPYTLKIEKYLGEAELDADGRDTRGTRNDHQWRRVRYSYMDCRREANRRGLVIRGPRKIFDSSPAHIAFLYVSERGDFSAFHNAVFERFWRRELDIESLTVLRALLNEFGFDGDGFEAYLNGAGRARYTAMQADAEAAGVFGVPSYLIDGELFWGLERIERVRERLELR
ncbi:MAG: DsbA family protein [Gammaproteobacteria bacterium]|nr:DsbA family protein [Gammaproteobacteria bacterium]